MNEIITKEIVVAAYDKDLSWLDTIQTEIKKTIYRKGSKNIGKDEIFIEPNVGRCVHTFFNHIYTNYDNLSDYTFFVQDYPFDHWGNLIYVIHSDPQIYPILATLNIGGYYGFHNNTLGTAWHMYDSKQFGSGKVLICLNNGHPQDTNPDINVDRYWEILFDEPKPNMYEFMPGGHFLISKEQVLLRPREFYKKIVDLLTSEEVAPWLIERLECYIFNEKYKIK
jgi:hypothetical protein